MSDSIKISVGVCVYGSSGPGAAISPKAESANIFRGHGLSRAIPSAIRLINTTTPTAGSAIR